MELWQQLCYAGKTKGMCMEYHLGTPEMVTIPPRRDECEVRTKACNGWWLQPEHGGCWPVRSVAELLCFVKEDQKMVETHANTPTCICSVPIYVIT